jgi:hypothetical protein
VSSEGSDKHRISCRLGYGRYKVLESDERYEVVGWIGDVKACVSVLHHRTK